MNAPKIIKTIETIMATAKYCLAKIAGAIIDKIPLNNDVSKIAIIPAIIALLNLLVTLNVLEVYKNNITKKIEPTPSKAVIATPNNCINYCC